MAADSKHSVPHFASVLCENRNDPQEKASNSNEYPWQEELQTTRDYKIVNDILERRSAEIRQLYEQCQDSADQCRCLKKEWLALVTEKDRNLRQQIEEENEQAKKEQMRQLYQVLENLSTFSFNKPNETILKRNLAKMHHQIGKYCSRNNIPIEITKKGTGAVESPEVPTAPPPPQMLIPPPPPPPPLTPLTTNKVTMEKHSKNLLKKRIISTAQNNPSTPHNQTNEELLKRIRTGCRSELRSTPFKRSPGGTPFKRQRRMSDSDTSDLITLALKRKFQNVAVQSPKENESPRSIMSPGDLQ